MQSWQAAARNCPVWAAVALVTVGVAGLGLGQLTDFGGQYHRLLLTGVPAALLVAGTVFWPLQQPGRLGTWLVLGGDASFALYLSHPFSINVVILGWQKLHLGAPWLFIAVTIVVAVLAAIVIHLVLERPLLDRLNAMLARPARPAPHDPQRTGRQMTATHTPRVETIDVFRGIAILLVVLYHFTARLPPAALNVSGMPAPPVFFGWAGVYFFFAISGYCIFLTLEHSATVSLFLARRFSRLYPAFFAAAIFLFIYGLVAPPPSVPEAQFHERPSTVIDLLTNLVFLGDGRWVNGSFWSIAVEIKFYVGLGLLALMIPDRQRLAVVFSWISLAAPMFWMVGMLYAMQTGKPSAGETAGARDDCALPAVLRHRHSGADETADPAGPVLRRSRHHHGHDDARERPEPARRRIHDAADARASSQRWWPLPKACRSRMCRGCRGCSRASGW